MKTKNQMKRPTVICLESVFNPDSRIHSHGEAQGHQNYANCGGAFDRLGLRYRIEEIRSNTMRRSQRWNLS